MFLFTKKRSATLASFAIFIFLGGMFFPTVFAADSLVNSPTVIGTGEFDFADGSASEASFSFPYGLAYSEKLDALIIADMQNHRIRSLDLNTMEVITIAGTEDGKDRFGFPAGGYVDGDADQALFNRPRGIAVAENGAILVADTGNHAIRQIFEGQVTTIAGGDYSGYLDGQGTEARFLYPSGIAIDEYGTIFVADTLNNMIRMIDTESNVTTLAGRKTDTSIFNEPTSLTLDDQGNLYVADGGNHRIKKVTFAGQVVEIAGNASVKDAQSGYWLGGYLDAAGENAYFNFPKGVVLSPQGILYVADSYNHVIRGIDLTIENEEQKEQNQQNQFQVYTVAGKGIAGENIGGASKIEFDGPVALAWGKDTLFVADHWNNRIVAIPKDGAYLEAINQGNNAEKSPGENIPVYLNGRETIFPDVQPFIKEDRVRVPVRAIAEAWGAQVLWNAENRSFTVSREGKEVTFQESKEEFFTHNNRSMVKLRTLGEKLNLNVEWLNGKVTLNS